ncbi:Carbohydrate binding module (family 6) [Glycomyces harbinensis]|uniref:Carbohydrate binding module (Family 6) n=1 Tax=Glycomyces harbinensis TaxID=58114 RepID=A0A1G6R9D1_9ACTN|nr:Carbohydrate binding module (family 6) [Glycomyces harbinensis]
MVAGLTGLVAVAATLVAMNAASAAPVRHEAETSPATCAGTIDSNHAGYSGGGFCNSDNAVGAAVQFTVNAASAGSATLGIRYANGGTADRPADITVNGSVAQSAGSFPTGSWTGWTTKTLTVPVVAGSNTIRVAATTANGLANIDYLDFEVGGSTEPTTPPTGSAIYVAPGGTDGAAGTISAPTTLTSAISRVTAGGTIYMRGGTYNYSSTVVIPETKDGTSSARIALAAYGSEVPVLNFSAQSEASTNRGLAVYADYWHVKGLIVERAGDNGIFVSGSGNIFERTITRYNRDSGLQLSRQTSTSTTASWPRNNLVISAESHDNADSDGEDADGFAAKLTVGSGNVFRYAVAHNNADDGWDLYTYSDYDPIGTVTIEYSLSYRNGTLSNGTVFANGDRNGYKLGGEDVPINHTVRYSIAFDNGQHGFTYNSNPGSMTISNNLGIDSTERNFNFDAGSSTFRNNTSCFFSGATNDRVIGNSDSSNQFYSGSNGSRCSNYSGALGWSFAGDGRLVVTLGGRTVSL